MVGFEFEGVEVLLVKVACETLFGHNTSSSVLSVDAIALSLTHKPDRMKSNIVAKRFQ